MSIEAGIEAGRPSKIHVTDLWEQVEALEADILKNFGEDVLYTFSQIHGNTNGNVMVRLKDRSKTESLIAKGEELSHNYGIDPWFDVKP